MYVEEMIMKNIEGCSHGTNLEDILQSFKKYNMHLNPAKCSFEIHDIKFLGFMLTNRGIKANLNKCQDFINIRCCPNIKEVQQLIGRLVILPRFLSYVSDKAFLFFTHMNKKERFEWTRECKEVVSKIKTFFTSPLIFTCPREGSPLVQETDKAKSIMYFVRKVFKGAAMPYQNFEKIMLVIIVATRKLWPYFQGHKVLVKTSNLVRQVL